MTEAQDRAIRKAFQQFPDNEEDELVQALRRAYGYLASHAWVTEEHRRTYAVEDIYDALVSAERVKGDLGQALEAMLDLITSGRHYETQNPYTRPEVEQAYRALGRDWKARVMADTLEGMTQDRWDSLSADERDRLRDDSNLTPQLVELEGWRVEVEDHYGKVRRFIVGVSTGWRPIHLEISRRNAYGGGAASRSYRSVRKLYYAR